MRRPPVVIRSPGRLTGVTVLVLASASPARRQLLAAAGIAAEVMVSGFDESTVDSPDPAALGLELARAKASAVAERLGDADALVLGCDSVLEFDGQALGKPADAAEATRRWYEMRGRSGVLHTGHCVIQLGTGKRAEAVASTTVHFAEVTDDEVAAYVSTGEPLRVAGAFTIDGLGGPFIEYIEGDHSNVVGLSLPLLRRLVGELGHRVTDFWASV
ncbi:MAG: septum formation inhibitor Maf [Actinobacteria bacterium]|nr:MAG: septum formation inhibitor Maf [Actinomycetota bacterium]